MIYTIFPYFPTNNKAAGVLNAPDGFKILSVKISEFVTLAREQDAYTLGMELVKRSGIDDDQYLDRRSTGGGLSSDCEHQRG